LKGYIQILPHQIIIYQQQHQVGQLSQPNRAAACISFSKN